MSQARSLAVVSPHHQAAYAIRKQLADGAARVDAVTVRRDWQRAMDGLLWDVSPEMLKAEERLRQIRRLATEAERVEAWTRVAQLPDAQRRERPSLIRRFLRIAGVPAC